METGEDRLVIGYVDMEERDLLRRAQQGDRDAFGQLVSLYQARLRAICRNRMLNHFRSNKVRQNAAAALVDQALQETWGAMEDNLEDGAERVAALRRCVDRLEKSQRELIEMRYRREVPLAELARKLGRSAAALSMSLFRLRAALEKCMDRGLEHA